MQIENRERSSRVDLAKPDGEGEVTQSISEKESSHYQALDGLRGIAAFSIFVFHKVRFFNTNFSPPLHSFYLGVDFFFVLSGFVIALNYQESLMTKNISIKKFILLRVGRIYPLQLALTLFYGIRFWFSRGGVTKASIFCGMLVNLFLLQGIMPDERFSWNGPSWSISTEFWTYILFALYAAFILPWGRSRTFLGLLILCLLAALGFAKGTIGVWFTFYALLRCIAGFAAGVLLYNIWPQTKKLILQLPPNTTEVIVLGGLIAFYILSASLTMLSLVSFFAPFVFMMMLAVFAIGRGIISHGLKTLPFQEWGKLSYSIYMLHFLFTDYYMSFVYKLIKLHLFTGFITLATGSDEGIGGNVWAGDLAFLLASAGLILMSYGTYNYIEKPAREWVRKKLKMMK